MSNVTYLECTKCGAHLPADVPENVCSKDGGVLFTRYDLRTLKQTFKPEALKGREATLWRHREVLPKVEPITLGEGFTPLLRSREIFESVRVDPELGTIVWPTGADLDPDVLHEAGVAVAVRGS